MRANFILSVLILLIQSSLFAEFNKQTLSKMGIDSTTLFYFAYSVADPPPSPNGIKTGFKVTINREYMFVKYDLLRHTYWEKKSIKNSKRQNITCFIDTLQMAQIEAMLKKLDFFNLPEEIPTEKNITYSTLGLHFLVGFRNKVDDEIYLVNVVTHADTEYPQNLDKILHQMRSLLNKFADNCKE